MKRIWLLFSQAVTVLAAAYFVVATLQPQWLHRGVGANAVSVIEAPAGSVQPAGAGASHTGGFASAARVASAAVVSINTSKAASRSAQADDPWFKFFFGDQGSGEAQAGLGSGVIVSGSGYILTNNHVVEGADDIEVVLNDTRKAKARVIGTDPDTDLAILKIELDKLPVIVLGNSDALQVGDPVLAIGNPFGVGQTVTGGIVSALGRNQLESIVKDGQVTRGWIGVEPQDLNPELAAAFGLKPAAAKSGGVMIAGVLQNGPAAQAGIRPGDVITAVNGKTVGNVSQLLTAVAGLKPGTPAPLTVLREDGQTEIPVTPGKRQRPKIQR